MTIAVNTQLGPYLILVPLGAGGMGEVYRARDTRLDRDVAIKVLPSQFSNNQEFRTRFEREAKAVAALSHPNILAIYDVGHQDGVAYVVTELLEGETLRELLNRSTIPRRKALEIAAAVADGIAATHARGIVHRDLKPENIFVTTDSVVKILDFGLARVESAESPAQDSTHTPTVTISTTPGTIIGTINYMSPEQIRTARADARSDVFSFGCVLYEMLTGQKAFVGETSADTMTAILREPPRNIRTIRQDVGLELERVIDRCLEKKPEARFQSSHDLAFTVRSILADSGLIPSKQSPARSKQSYRIVAIAVLAVVAVFALWRLFTQERTSKSEALSSLVVLPFVNTSNDAEVEYIGDGISESVMNALARVPGLQVVPRSRAFSYKGNQADPIAVGRELGVQGVLTGRIVKRGDRLNIQAELAHVGHNRQVWGQQYELPADELLTTQQRIVKDISTILDVSLSGEQQQTLTARDPKSAEAYDWYLRGSYHWNRYSTEGFRKAIECFDRALEIDPLYAAAYAGLGMAYYRAATNVFPPLEAMPKAKRAAHRALELDSTIAEAHVVLGVVAYRFEWNWPQAEEAFKTAIRLAPDYATAHEEYGFYLGHLLRFDEAIAELEKASALDPLSLIIASRLAVLHMNAGHHDEAIARLRRTLDMDPGFQNSLINLPLALALAGRTGEALTETRRTLAAISDVARFAQSASCFALANEPDEARAALAELEAARSERYVNLVELAIGYACLGDRQRAMDLLEESYGERGEHVSRLLMEARLKDMRSDPRFRQLVEKIGLGDNLPKPLSSPRPTPSLKREGNGSSQSTEKIMLAVLPFENLSRDPEQEYFSDGLTEEMITQLGRLNPQALGVIARSSAMHYKNKDRTIEQVKRELGVDYVVEGSVRRADNRVRITATLILCSDQSQLWGDSFERELEDVLALQSEVAQAIAREIKITLTPQEQARTEEPRRINPEAHQAYLKGRFHWNKRTADGLRKAVEFFEQAVSLDPEWPLAHVGLADAYSVLSDYSSVQPREAISEARASVAKALQLDESLGEAHATMAGIASEYDFDWVTAEREFRRAITLSPNYATAHHWYARHLMFAGRHDEAMREIILAQELDPLSTVISVSVGLASYYAGNFVQAEVQHRKTLEFDPESAMAHIFLARSLFMQNRREEAIAEARKAVQLSESEDWFVADLGFLCAKGGQPEEARRILEDLSTRSKQAYVAPIHFAVVYAGLGEMGRVFEWLEKAYKDGDNLLRIIANPMFADVRRDPRFADLRRRLGLPELSPGDWLAARRPGDHHDWFACNSAQLSFCGTEQSQGE